MAAGLDEVVKLPGNNVIGVHEPTNLQPQSLVLILHFVHNYRVVAGHCRDLGLRHLAQLKMQQFCFVESQVLVFYFEFPKAILQIALGAGVLD